MAVESLNKYIKKDKLKDHSYIRLEKLLDVLEEVVDDKMWKRIIAIRRPNRNTYQGRVVAKAHKQAEKLKQSVEEKEKGHFIVKSLMTDKYYNISFKDHCTISNCREMFCEACSVCYHKYKCECVEYVIKSTTCKHVHAVALYKQSQVQDAIVNAQNVRCSTQENSQEINDFMSEKRDV